MSNRWIVAIYLLLAARGGFAQVQPTRTLSTIPKTIDGDFSPAIVNCYNPPKYSLTEVYCATAVRDTVGSPSSVHAAVAVITNCGGYLAANLTGQTNVLNFPVSQLRMTITPPGGVATTRQVSPVFAWWTTRCIYVWGVDLGGYGQFQVTVDAIDANGVHHKNTGTGPQ